MFTEPIYFKPLMMERVWGGNRLGRLFGKLIPAGQTIGESWELCDRPEAQSVVDGGRFDGLTLRQLMEAHPRELLGALPETQRFPLLLKYVDAGDRLSVQVHPDDAGAARYNDLGKSECWVIVRAEPGAALVRGLKPGTTRAQFEAAIAANRCGELLHVFEPRVGDVVALPPGMVHAIGAGLVIAELQQNSDLTFRIFDYNRPGLDGKPRKLHIQEALDAIRFDAPGTEFAGDMARDTVEPVTDRGSDVRLLDGRYFELRRVTLGAQPASRTRLDFPTKGAVWTVMVIEGSGTINARPVAAGTTGLIPAAIEHNRVTLETKEKLVTLFCRPKRA
jgi:mannose-6-phosphate isomerase